MTTPEVALLMLGLFILLVLLGFPIAFTLLVMGAAFGHYADHKGRSIEQFSDIFNNDIFYLLNQNTYSVMENPTLVAIPLFLFMGYVVERAHIIDKLFFSLDMAARNLPSSLAIAALLTCAVLPPLQSCGHGPTGRYGLGLALPVHVMDQAERKRVFDGQSNRNGVLALCGVMDLCIGLFPPRRPRPVRSMGRRHGS